MIDGFWLVQFEGMQGNGGGVVVFIKGQVFGGDSGYYYTGSYEISAALVKAHVQVRNFLPAVPNVLGVKGDFELSVTGTLEGDVIRGTASLVSPKGIGIAVKLTRKAMLPA